MNWARWFGTLLGLDNVESIEGIKQLSFSESWAAPAWVFFGCTALAVLAFVSYLKYEPRVTGKTRWWVASCRAIVLAIVFFLLAGPVAKVIYRESPQPLLYLVFDGTDSMNIRDTLGEEERLELETASGLAENEENRTDEPRSRMEYLKAFIKRDKGNVLERLGEQYRLRAFVLDRSDGLRNFKLAGDSDEDLDTQYVAQQLEATAPVTALGSAFEELATRYKREHLAGVVVFSDFGDRGGLPLAGTPEAPVDRLGVPFHTVGFGPVRKRDVTIQLRVSPFMKLKEQDTIYVEVGQTDLTGEKATVRVEAIPISATGVPLPDTTPILVGERTIDLTHEIHTVEMPFKPDEQGRFEVVATVDPLDGEDVIENNKARRSTTVRDEIRRLAYVAFEPNWEWRFIKEVFQRDRLVGLEGFRTFLQASDPDVRKANPLFLPRLEMKRSELLSNDVIFLGDMPVAALTESFCEMVKEHVGRFGGGLVVIAGPVYGPGQLANTPLADLLPVTIDPATRIRDEKEFRLQLTPAASTFHFMKLGATPEENQKAWNNLSRLPWYQPSKSKKSKVTVLAEHPTDTLANGDPQPLICMRRYGKGEVVYLAFDETWRLRRKYGEKYYRHFWGQMIYRMYQGHALGSQKRFIVRTDRERYLPDDDVVITVEASDENFEPLDDDKVEGRRLVGEQIIVDEQGRTRPPREFRVAAIRPGVFQTSLRLLAGGEHRLRILDPISGEFSEAIIRVSAISAERQNPVRNVALQRQISEPHGGKMYDLTSALGLPDDLKSDEVTKTTVRSSPLGSTWLCFLLVVGLVIGEWSIRKWVNVP